MFLAKIFALRSMGIQLVPSPHIAKPRHIMSTHGLLSWYLFPLFPNVLMLLSPFQVQGLDTNTLRANEPRHDKTNKVSVRPAKTQISLASAQSDQRLCFRMTKAWVLSYP